MRFEEAVEMVNTHNRPGAKPIVQIVTCDYCHGDFARSVNLVQREGSRLVCPDQGCQEEAYNERWEVSQGRLRPPPRRAEPTYNRFNDRIANLEKQIAAKSEELARVKAELLAWMQREQIVVTPD